MELWSPSTFLCESVFRCIQHQSFAQQKQASMDEKEWYESTHRRWKDGRHQHVCVVHICCAAFMCVKIRILHIRKTKTVIVSLLLWAWLLGCIDNHVHSRGVKNRIAFVSIREMYEQKEHLWPRKFLGKITVPWSEGHSFVISRLLVLVYAAASENKMKNTLSARKSAVLGDRRTRHG